MHGKAEGTAGKGTEVYCLVHTQHLEQPKRTAHLALSHGALVAVGKGGPRAQEQHWGVVGPASCLGPGHHHAHISQSP